MLSRPYVFGYHGCDAGLVRQLAAGEADLFQSESEFEWLGHGIYFWEDSPDRALRWAKEKMAAGTHKITRPAVIGAIIDLGNCLNLVDSRFIALVKEAYETYRETMVQTGRKMPVNRGFAARALDCAVIESLHKSRSKNPFQTVRSFFLEGRPVYEGAGFRELDHVQICVRDAARIKGYFLPR